MTPADRSLLHSAFLGERRLALGSLADVARAAAAAVDAEEPLLVFDGEGRQVELDLRGGPEQAALRATAAVEPPAQPPPPRGRGRPQLGVVAREVTLLPRHWEWLAAQPGGASVTLRKLVEEARRSTAETPRAARERVYRFLNAMAGNLPAYEDAMRALFAGDAQRFAALKAAWPADIRNHAHLLSAGAFDANESKT
ncbi:MAG: DUF2239 family protein [Comamonadaceae bacterium]|nr:MAG: DUF2239 family protein [Comamonadaceae bacterium]